MSEKEELKLLRNQIKVQGMISNSASKELGIVGNSLNRAKLAELIDSSHNQKRDLYGIYGYTRKPELKEYRERYERQDIAKRIVEAYPTACWSVLPTVTDDDTKQNESVFEKELNKQLTDLKIPWLSYLRKADIMAGLGHYAVIFIGIRDGLDPVNPIQGKLSSEDILFAAAYTEMNIEMHKYVEDPQDPRYGKPLTYMLSTSPPTSTTGSHGSKGKSFEVHYSRIIHICEGSLENDLIGLPRLKPVLNRLVDLEKIAGGGAESFFLNARGGLHMNQQPDTQLGDTKLLEERMQDFTHSMTRYLRTKGMDVNAINFDIADPKNHYDIITGLIASSTRIPRRILLGSEQGKLASEQDERNWHQQVQSRQKEHCEKMLLRPLVDWFIEVGILPKPINGRYTVKWPDMYEMSDTEKSENAVRKTQALANYVNAQGAEIIMPPEQLFEDILGMEFREQDLANPLDFDDVDDEDM